MAEKKTAAKKEEAPKVPGGSEFWKFYRNIEHVQANHDPEKDVYTVVGARGDVWEVEGEDFRRRFRPVTPNKA